MTEPVPWPVHRADLQAALSAFLARVEGDERRAALVVSAAGLEGRAYQLLDATWFAFNRTAGDFTTRPDLRDRLQRDILALAAMEDGAENQVEEDEEDQDE